jgi:carbon monoxide dehydrogenase subunit G
MNVIDYRILIQAPPEAVWKVVSDVKRNTEWQTNCKAVSILTNIGQNGAGMRWRATSASNKDYVVQVTAWYDRIGYEYTFTDGAPYKFSKGQVRLQETAEGTLVQWTFQYDLTGMLSGLKNSLGHKRAVEKEIIDSLQNLHKLMSRLVADARYESKSLMRDAPDVRARQQYKPRHPSVFEPSNTPEAEAQRPTPKLDPFNFDPPRADDDTRPLPAVKVDPIPDTPAILSTRESAVVAPSVEPVASPPEAKPEPTPAPTPPPIRQEVTPPPAPPVAPSVEAPPAPEPQRPPDKLDTASVSVFDLFGIPRPSATQESQAVKVDAEPPAPTPSEPITPAPEGVTPVERVTPTEPTALKPTAIESVEAARATSTSITVKVEYPDETPRYGRVGLRYKLRWESVKLRRP